MVINTLNQMLAAFVGRDQGADAQLLWGSVGVWVWSAELAHSKTGRAASEISNQEAQKSDFTEGGT
jgi:hypothetical protein